METCLLLLCIAILILILCFFLYRKSSSHLPSNESISISRESFSHSSDFFIYNYLISPIQISVMSQGKEEVLENKIPGNSKRGFKLKTIKKYFVPHNEIIVYIHTSLGLKRFGKYVFMTPKDTVIKALHVGMITSRWVGADADYNIAKPGLNAVQGLPWIKIWNTTDLTLSLNNNIDISPGGLMRYPGRDHFGVRLGTVFKDQNNIFPDFIFTIPATDVYYGIVSDLQQPLFGGFQLTPFFHHDEEEPQYLLENGWFYGKAEGKIPYGYIPKNGPPTPPTNRWGEQK